MQLGRDRLREWITRSNANQHQAAEILGMSDVFMSQILNGVRTPGLENAVKIESITGISVESWLLSDVSNDEDAEPASARKRKVAGR